MRHDFASSNGNGPSQAPSMFWPVHPWFPIASVQHTKMPRHIRNMGITIPVAHDFICPWCWVGLLQARRLEQEFGVRFEWLGYELFPIELEWPEWKMEPSPPNKPPVLSRFDFILVADDIEMPTTPQAKKDADVQRP